MNNWKDVQKEWGVWGPKFPVIDAHNHLWGDWTQCRGIEKVMDASGVVLYCDLTANISIVWAGGGYEFQSGDINDFFRHSSERFYAFTAATFSRSKTLPLFSDAAQFQEETIRLMREHAALGAKGLKILKELGLHYRDDSGNLIFMDDKRLAPIWDEAADLDLPVLIHQSDPFWFFEPVTPENEHYESLKKYPAWSFADRNRYPGKMELLERRDRTVKNHPRTRFILPHVANYAENLDYVSRLLDDNPNVSIDFSARMDEIGRKPQETRSFMVQHQDRIIFGTDMPVSEEVYRAYYRFLETRDEPIVPPDYDGTFERYRWKITGLELPDQVLKKIYHQNILDLIPSLREPFARLLEFPGFSQEQQNKAD